MNVRLAAESDLRDILRIYNEGIQDRIATLEADTKTSQEIVEWWREHDARYAVIVAEESEAVVGWASLNRFSHRCAHSAIADLSVYVARDRRGFGVGTALLSGLLAKAKGFRKIVLYALNENAAGKRLYARMGFREVGIFREHGILDGRLIDVVAMERIL